MTLQELKEKIRSGELTDIEKIADVIGNDDEISMEEYRSLKGKYSFNKAEILFKELSPNN